MFRFLQGTTHIAHILWIVWIVAKLPAVNDTTLATMFLVNIQEMP